MPKPPIPAMREGRPAQRLSAGRHQLAAQEVETHQRQRLINAMAALCAERGYAHVVITEVVARAAVSKATFYRFFATKDECLFAAHKYFSAALLAAIDASCDSAGEWPARLRAGVHAALAFCAARPDAVHPLALAILSCGPEGISRYRVTIEALAKRLHSGGDSGGERHADAVFAVVVFAAPLIPSSAGENGSEEILALENDILEMILAFSVPNA